MFFMPHPLKKDYHFFLAADNNNDGHVIVKIIDRLHVLIKDIRQWMTDVQARIIYRSNIFAHLLDPEVRKNEEWLAAERLILSQYGAEFMNPSIRCLTGKTCFALDGKYADLPPIEGVLKRPEDGTFFMGRKFFFYLEDLAKNSLHVWNVQKAAADEDIVEFGPEDVEICFQEEFEELLERRRGEIQFPVID